MTFKKLISLTDSFLILLLRDWLCDIRYADREAETNISLAVLFTKHLMCLLLHKYFTGII